MATPTLDRATILKAIRGWPQDEQLALAKEILRHADAPIAEDPLVPPDSRGLAGLLATEQAPLTPAARDAFADAAALGEELSARYGMMPDSTDLIRDDRAR